MVISNPTRKILVISPPWEGCIHDYALMKELFPPDQDWFSAFRVMADSGYQGLQKEYRCKEVLLPHKKKGGKQLDDAQKMENQELARERIRVEHSIGGMKRYRILTDRLRMHDFSFYDDVLEVCAGLWNFKLTM
ncbi:MAG: hypothetical protein EAZ89_15480 [Bacteroidetes bacterium]|jgi:hypothetical protein|nr:MAG: hypothetical protein EAZ89_15480 [Bacteroidota bacterium]